MYYFLLIIFGAVLNQKCDQERVGWTLFVEVLQKAKKEAKI